MKKSKDANRLPLNTAPRIRTPESSRRSRCRTTKSDSRKRETDGMENCNRTYASLLAVGGDRVTPVAGKRSLVMRDAARGVDRRTGCLRWEWRRTPRG